MRVNQKMVLKVVSNVVDFDQEYLFRPLTPMENMEDADTGSYDVQQRKILRERSYGVPPVSIKLQPDYGGNFLDKLKNSLVHQRAKEVNAAKNVNALEDQNEDPTNIYDISGPDTWLKHQEKPSPRILLDEFYENNRPGDGAGADTLKQYWNRSWGPDEAPEVSEDRPLRNGPKVGPSFKVPFKTAGKSVVSSYISEQLVGEDYGGLCPSTVVASFLLRECPQDAVIDIRNMKTAKLLRDLEHPVITTKGKGYTPVRPNGVTAKLYGKGSSPKEGRWAFFTTSGKEVYTTMFQFLPKGQETDLERLDVRVSCSCPSWLYWGAQFNAYRGNYLYGPIKPKLSDPDKRDPIRKFLVCKHVLACIPVVKSFHLEDIIPKNILRKETDIIPLEKLPKKIPGDLMNAPRTHPIRGVLKKWESMSPKDRLEFIEDLDSPSQVAYLAYRFPETAMRPAVTRLKDLIRELEGPLKTGLRKQATFFLSRLEQFATGIPDLPGDKKPEDKKEVEVPKELGQVERIPSISRMIDNWPESSGGQKGVVRRLNDPKALALLGYKIPESLEFVIPRLKEILEEGTDSEKEIADKYLEAFV